MVDDVGCGVGAGVGRGVGAGVGRGALHQLSNESRTHEPCMYTQSKYANLQSPLTPENEQPAE